MVACEASGAREHGHDSKLELQVLPKKQEHQVEGPIRQVEHAGTKVTKGR
jgi:hypothetical protein